MEEWRDLAARLARRQVDFMIVPSIRFEGQLEGTSSRFVTEVILLFLEIRFQSFPSNQPQLTPNLAVKARAAGVPIELHLRQGQLHNYAGMPTPEGRQARAMILRFIAQGRA